MTNKVAPTDVMLTRKCLISIGMVLSTLSISPENLQLFKCGNQTEILVYKSKCYEIMCEHILMVARHFIALNLEKQCFILKFKIPIRE